MKEYKPPPQMKYSFVNFINTILSKISINFHKNKPLNNTITDN